MALPPWAVLLVPSQSLRGSGSKLKDIPNVQFKLSKRKVDENLQSLHVLMYGRKSNVHFLKRNISQFSGFVWTDNQEKQRARIKEKLDKFNKEKLLDFCEILDIYVSRATTKKEEVSAKLLEFLESPCITREVVLTDDKKGKKRGRRSKGNGQTTAEGASEVKDLHIILYWWKTVDPGGFCKEHVGVERTRAVREQYYGGVVILNDREKRRKSRKQSAESAKENDDEDDEGPAGSEDVSMGEEDDEDSEAKDNAGSDEEPDEPPAKKKPTDDKQTKKAKENDASGKKASTKPAKGVTKPSQDTEDEPEAELESKRAGKKVSKSSKESDVTVDKASKKVTKSKKDEGKEGQNNNSGVSNNKARKKDIAKTTTKNKGKGKGSTEAGAAPTTEELHAVVSDILKEVDFNTATLADILRQLGTHFKMDLMDRKSEVKHIIEEVINSMSDDEEGEEENAEEDADKNTKDENSKEDGDEK
uniref:DEK-C domain-containing protein n=1 Tax=Oryza brachyantha TaxID=4533 RepID=J3L7C3_ORYBR